MYAQVLLDKARQKWKSDAQIAAAIGVTRQSLHAFSTGKAKMPPERAALLAAALGEDADYAAKRVMVDNAEGDLHARLAKAFRVAAGVAGVAVLVALGNVPLPANAGTIRTDREDLTSEVTAQTLYWRALRWLIRRLLALMARGILRATALASARDRHPTPAAIAAAG